VIISKSLALPFLLAVVFGLGILTLPALPYSGDPYAWREEARSIVLHGTLDVDPESATLGLPGEYFDLNPADHKWYSKYGVLNGLLNAIPLLAEKLITGELPPYNSQDRVLFLGVFFVLQAVLIAYVLFLITGHYTQNLAVRMAYVMLAFYTTYLWNYLRATNSEATQLLFFALTYLSFLCHEKLPQPIAERSGKYIYLGWLALFALCLTKVSYFTFLPLFAALHICYAARQGMLRSAWMKFIAQDLVLPMAVIVGIQAAIQKIKFGDPTNTGYFEIHQIPHAHTLWSATADYIWGWQGSIFIHFPLLLLALPGIRKFIRRHMHDTFFLLGALIITYIMIAPAYGPWRGEWCYGPRYLVPFLPLLALPALYPLEWILNRPHTASRMAALLGITLAGAFLFFVQMQVNRMDYFFRYRIEVKASPGGEPLPQSIADYFEHTNFAKLNWDHLQTRGGHWENLPYYADMQTHLSPENIKLWQQFVSAQVSRSNLYWFPEANAR